MGKNQRTGHISEAISPTDFILGTKVQPNKTHSITQVPMTLTKKDQGQKSLSFRAIRPIRSEPISDFCDGWPVALTTSKTGRQFVAGNFPSKTVTGTHLHLGRVKK